MPRSDWPRFELYEGNSRRNWLTLGSSPYDEKAWIRCMRTYANGEEEASYIYLTPQQMISLATELHERAIEMISEVTNDGRP